MPVLTHQAAVVGASAENGERPTVEWARELAARLVPPTVADRDRDRVWDPQVFAELAGSRPGILGAFVPSELGGSGLCATRAFELLEGLGEGMGDPGLALMTVAHAVLATVPLLAFGSSAQQARYLPRMATGEWLGAVSLNQTQGAAQTPGIAARPCEQRPGEWELQGTMDLVAGAPVAHHFLVIASHEDGERTAFLIDGSTPGVLVSKTDPMAMPTCPWGRVVLDRCRLPHDAVLGTVGGASTEVEPLLAVLDWVFTSAPWLGIMRTLARMAGDVVHERLVFGQPLAHDQSARFVLAELATLCELADGMLRHAAAQFDAPGKISRQDAAAARLFTAEAARAVVEGTARLAGPSDAGSYHLISRAHRDMQFFAETGGGTAVLRSVIAACQLNIAGTEGL